MYAQIMRCMHRSRDVCTDHAMYAQIMGCMHRSCDVCIDQIMQGKYLWTMISSMVIWSQCDVHVTSSMTEVYKGFPKSQCSTPDDQLQ